MGEGEKMGQDGVRSLVSLENRVSKCKGHGYVRGGRSQCIHRVGEGLSAKIPVWKLTFSEVFYFL